MIATKALTRSDIKEPINLNSKAFIANKYAYYKWLREEAPVYKGKVSIVINAYLHTKKDTKFPHAELQRLLKETGFVSDTGANGPAFQPATEH